MEYLEMKRNGCLLVRYDFNQENERLEREALHERQHQMHS